MWVSLGVLVVSREDELWFGYIGVSLLYYIQCLKCGLMKALL